MKGRAAGRSTPLSGGARQEHGSILLFVLFVCLGLAVLAQCLGAVVMAGNGAIRAEEAGRSSRQESEGALLVLRQRLLTDWGERPWSIVGQAPQVEAEVSSLADGGEQIKVVSARAGTSAPVVSAWVERGKDGLDLPSAGLVARAATWASGRVTPWVTSETDASGGQPSGQAVSPAAVYLLNPPEANVVMTSQGSLVGEGVSLRPLTSEWRLDAGWRAFFEGVAVEGVALGPDSATLAAQAGTIAELPTDWGRAASVPSLLVVTGGGTLDVRRRGDIYGVLVVDDGSILLDGTMLHGAAFATGGVDFGVDGRLVFSSVVLRWATDGSLVRTRLVPGTWSEATG